MSLQPTWAFTEHRYAGAPRWTWAQVSGAGRVRSSGNAQAHAALRGFDAARDTFRAVELNRP